MRTSQYLVLLLLCTPFVYSFGFETDNILYESAGNNYTSVNPADGTEFTAETIQGWRGSINTWSLNSSIVPTFFRGNYTIVHNPATPDIGGSNMVRFNATKGEPLDTGGGAFLSLNPIYYDSNYNLSFTFTIYNVTPFPEVKMAFGLSNNTGVEPNGGAFPELFTGIILQNFAANAFDVNVNTRSRGGNFDSVTGVTFIPNVDYFKTKIGHTANRGLIDFNFYKNDVLQFTTTVSEVNETFTVFEVNNLFQGSSRHLNGSVTHLDLFSDAKHSSPGDRITLLNNSRVLNWSIINIFESSFPQLAFFNSSMEVVSSENGINFTIQINNTIINISNLKTVPVTINFNLSNFQGCMFNGSNCPIFFRSLEGGSFNFSKINISFINFATPVYSKNLSDLEFNSILLNFNGSLGAVNMSIVYGGPTFRMTSVITSTAVFNKTITVPSSNFYFNYNLTFTNGSFYSGNTGQYLLLQSDINFSFASCADGSVNTSIKTWLAFESDNATKATNLQSYFRIWKNDPLKYKNFSFIGTGANFYNFCLEPRNTTFLTDAYFDFNKPILGSYDSNFENRQFYIFNTSINGSITSVYLFMANNSADTISVFVKDFNDYPLTGAYVQAYKFMTSINEWRLVESKKADVLGLSIMYLFPYTELYRFVVYYQNKKYVVSEQVISAATINLKIDTQGGYLDNYNHYKNIIHSLAFNNGSKTFTFSYSDLDSSITQGCISVKRSRSSSVEVCRQCSALTSDVLSCLVNTSQDGVYIGTGSVNIAGVNTVLDVLEVPSFASGPPFGFNGVALAFIIVAFFTLLFSFSGAAGVLFGLSIGVIVASITLLWLPLGVLIVLLIVIGAFFWRVRQ